MVEPDTQQIGDSGQNDQTVQISGQIQGKTQGKQQQPRPADEKTNDENDTTNINEIDYVVVVSLLSVFFLFLF